MFLMNIAQHVWALAVKDKNGNVKLWQRPNLPIIVWALSFLLSRTLPYGQLNFIAALVAFGSLFTWAWLELFSGINYFRRSLGLVVLIILIFSQI